MTYEPCPECDADVRWGGDHDSDCLYLGYDSDSLAEIKDSWDRQYRIDANQEKT